jgi:FtsP/CotA-like multicopper oxidase with cupredoxin domain
MTASLTHRAAAGAALLILAATLGCSGRDLTGCTDCDNEPLGDANPYDRATTRWYYIAADEVAWDYAPSGFDMITGEAFTEAAEVFVGRGPNRIGREYVKALYREYTDASFQTLKPIPPEWDHLGTVGPVIRAVVGDTIKIVFRNNAGFTASMHPHGVFYDKDSEGADYEDGTSGGHKGDGLVPPGGTHTYTWIAPKRAGPGPADPSSIVWMYHSHTDETRDTYTGLIGPIIVMAPGAGRPDGRPRGVDREFITLFVVYDENKSWYLERNIEEYAEEPETVDPEDEGFIESNLMHGINGYVFGNMPGLVMRRGEQVRWYVLGMGTEIDLHTPHWHGQTGLWNGMRTDILEILPASMKVFDMVPDNPGTWLFHCHVNDHLDAGMLAVFTVE